MLKVVNFVLFVSFCEKTAVEWSALFIGEADEEDAHLVGLGGMDADPFFDRAGAAIGVFTGQGVEPGE